MNWLRRALLEMWAVFVIAAVVGFMGPFGTYLDSTVMDRIAQWWKLLLGAYLLVRPAIAALRWVARGTALPERILVGWGVIATSAPLAMIWRSVGQDAYRQLDGYAALVPFALLCALAVLAVEAWASQTDRRLVTPTEQQAGDRIGQAPDDVGEAERGEPLACRPQLMMRLSRSFAGPIIALQSEDHYVRVHGVDGSELILMRLRDAIAELGEMAGEQVHRSWWVAREGVAGAEPAGRSWTIRLQNGASAPVARDSVERLRKSGFLPDAAPLSS